MPSATSAAIKNRPIVSLVPFSAVQFELSAAIKNKPHVVMIPRKTLNILLSRNRKNFSKKKKKNGNMVVLRFRTSDNFGNTAEIPKHVDGIDNIFDESEIMWIQSEEEEDVESMEEEGECEEEEEEIENVEEEGETEEEEIESIEEEQVESVEGEKEKIESIEEEEKEESIEEEEEEESIEKEEEKISKEKSIEEEEEEENEEEHGTLSTATFRYTVKNVSEMENTQLSPACYAHNLAWKIMVMSLSSQTQEEQQCRSFGFFLLCDGDDKLLSWTCYVHAELRLLSCKKGQEPFSRKIQHLFCSEMNDWGFTNFMAWQDVLNPDKGFIKDDTITLEVYVEADALYNPCQREVTFRYTVENVFMVNGTQLSPTCYVCNLPCKIVVPQTNDENKGLTFGFFLCTSVSNLPKWSCYADAELRLLSCKEGQRPFSRACEGLFCRLSEGNKWGFSRFITWHDVLDPDKGFIKNDSITLEVYFKFKPSIQDNCTIN